MKIRVGARSSPLSRVQMEEVYLELSAHHPHVLFVPVWVKTTGDFDKKSSLRDLGKTDFFTRELDRLLLKGRIRIAIHSAKDLPDPLPRGLELCALTRGVDPRDSLVFRAGETLESLPSGAVIATSSERREKAVKKLRSDLRFIDLRGDIEERLALLEEKKADGVVVAEAALIRLKLAHLNRMILPEEAAPLQGRLAVVARGGDAEMQTLFAPLQFACQQ